MESVDSKNWLITSKSTAELDLNKRGRAIKKRAVKLNRKIVFGSAHFPWQERFISFSCLISNWIILLASFQPSTTSGWLNSSLFIDHLSMIADESQRIFFQKYKWIVVVVNVLLFWCVVSNSPSVVCFLLNVCALLLMPDNYNNPTSFLTDLFTFLQPRLSNPARVRLSNSFGSPLLNAPFSAMCSHVLIVSHAHVSMSLCPCVHSAFITVTPTSHLLPVNLEVEFTNPLEQHLTVSTHPSTSHTVPAPPRSCCPPSLSLSLCSGKPLHNPWILTQNLLQQQTIWADGSDLNSRMSHVMQKVWRLCWTRLSVHPRLCWLHI